MLESLTVMGVDHADSRDRRAPWGAVKFLKAVEKKRPKAINFELDKLMIVNNGFRHHVHSLLLGSWRKHLLPLP